MPGPLNRPARPPDIRRRPWGGAWTTRAVGGLPLPVADIPVTWLSDPLTLRLDQPLTHAEVTQDGGATARADSNTIGVYGAFPFTATLNTAVDADASNLAHWTVTYNSTPRMRSPSLTINLLYRTDAEKAYLLQIGRGRRIRLTGLPNEWPVGANYLVVRGIQHQATTFGRTITWVTGPVIGLTPTVSDAFSRVTAAGGWGTADTGQAWSVISGAAAQFSTDGSSGLMTHSAPGFTQISLPYTSVNDEIVAKCSVSSIANYGDFAVQLRFTDTSNYYRAVYRFDANTFEIDVRVGGATTTIGGPVSPLAGATLGPVKIRFQAIGTSLKARAWLASSDEPTAWHVTATDSTLSSGTGIALSSFDATAAKVFTYDDVAVFNGSNPLGVSGPWFRWGSSSWGGTDVRPF